MLCILDNLVLDKFRYFRLICSREASCTRSTSAEWCSSMDFVVVVVVVSIILLLHSWTRKRTYLERKCIGLPLSQIASFSPLDQVQKRICLLIFYYRSVCLGLILTLPKSCPCSAQSLLRVITPCNCSWCIWHATSNPLVGTRVVEISCSLKSTAMEWVLYGKVSSDDCLKLGCITGGSLIMFVDHCCNAPFVAAGAFEICDCESLKLYVGRSKFVLHHQELFLVMRQSLIWYVQNQP